MTRTECCGLKVVKSNLDPNRETVIRSMVDCGPYGQIEDWSGSVVVKVTEACILNDECIGIIAEALANDEIYRSVVVSEWTVKREGRFLKFVPKEWEEIDVDSGLVL